MTVLSESPKCDTHTRSVLYEKRGRAAYITLNRPHVHNAMDRRMHQELEAVWDDFESDDELWLAVLTGAGTRSFSVGQDLKELAARYQTGESPSSVGSGSAPGGVRFTERFGLTKPVIARVNGYALGGGFELALACDIIVACEDARFALPEAKLGLIPGAGGVFRLTRQVPFKTAIGHLLTGRWMTAAQAGHYGLVSEVVPNSELDACVDRWVHDVLRCAPLSVRAIKQMALQSSHLSLPEAFRSHYDVEQIRRNSEDCIEGPSAFLEKRAPRWTGSPRKPNQ
jgi:dehydration protein DpgD